MAATRVNLPWADTRISLEHSVSLVQSSPLCRRVEEVNKMKPGSINYSQIKYTEFDKIPPADLILASDLLYDSKGEDIASISPNSD